MLRRTYKPVELGGIWYLAGVVFMLPLLCVHHDKEVWGADADEFRPERFAEGISKASADPCATPLVLRPCATPVAAARAVSVCVARPRRRRRPRARPCMSRPGRPPRASRCTGGRRRNAMHWSVGRWLGLPAMQFCRSPLGRSVAHPSGSFQVSDSAGGDVVASADFSGAIW